MATTFEINNTTVGQFVRYLYLKELPEADSNITITDLQDLHKACPNLELIDTLDNKHIKTGKNKSAFPCWEKLTHIDRRVNIYMKSWVLKQEQQQRQNQQPINTIVSFSFNIYTYIDDIIITEFKHRFSFYNENINENENIYETVDFHTPYLSFISTWHHLTSLSITFGPDYFIAHNYFVLTDHTFESIQQSCPSLESLSMTEVDLHVTNDYKINHRLIIPFIGLTSLSLMECVISDTHIFNYVSKKYPQLSKIKFHFYLGNDEGDDFAIQLHNMINHLSYLNHLSIDFAVHPDYEGEFTSFEPGDDVFFHDEFKQWLLEHPYQIQSLVYPYSLISPSVLNYQLYEMDYEVDDSQYENESDNNEKQNQDENDSDSQDNQSYYDSEDNLSYKESNNDSDDNQSYDKSNRDKENDQSVISPIDQQRQQQKELLLLDDLFYENEQKIQAAYTLTSIALSSINYDEVGCPITHFLNTFPNLKELEISYAKICDFKIKNEKVEELSPSLIYPLEKLILVDVDMPLNVGLTKLFNHCPRLKKIHWDVVAFYTKYKRTILDFFDKNNIPGTMIIDLKQLHIDEINIRSIFINQNISYHSERVKIIVNEVRDNEIKETIESQLSSSSSSSYKLQIDCNSVDVVQLEKFQ